MQITVVGGSGFVGSHVVDALIDAGHRVRVIDTRPPLRVEADWREVDLLDDAALVDALAGSEIVFHLAAMADVNDVLANPVESVELNTLGTVRVLEAARRADTGRVILASTVWVYAATHGQEVDEETLFDLEADKHIYVSEKLAAEMFCRDYLNLYGRPYTVLRYGIPYGPRMRSDLVVAAFLERALRGEAISIDGDGSQERRFVYVEDLAAAHVLALDPAAENRTFNLESTEATSIREIAESVRDLVGDVTVTFGPARKGDYAARHVSSDRARSELGWAPRTSFAEGMAKTLEWYRAQGFAPAPVPRREPAVVAPATAAGHRRIAIVPAYNEEPSVAAVLTDLSPLVDELIVVDDGSTDGTRAAIEAWMPGHPHCRLLCHDVNQGMSEAYLLALTHLRDRLQCGELDPDDLVFTVDADGQHDLAVLDELARVTVDEHVDAMLARRDLSYHGPFKTFGNWVLSAWASVWAGQRLYDVESGYRIFRLGALAHALDYYSGRKYSETVEVAVVMSRLGYRVRNDHLVPVPVARSRTSMTDAAIDFAAIPLAAARVWRADHGSNAPATLSLAAVGAMLLAVTIGSAAGGVAGFVLAAAAAGGAGLLVRRLVPNGSLPIAGAIVVAVSTWLVPQRTDTTSAVALVVLFSVGAAIASPPARKVRLPLLGACVAVLLFLRIDSLRTALLASALAMVVVESATALLRRPRARPNLRSRRVAFGFSIVSITAMTALYFGSSTVSATWFGGGVVHGPRNIDKVAITFDNGSSPQATAAMMQVLVRAKVPATFFLAGQTVHDNPQIVRNLYADGFLVGNQSYHSDHWRWMDPRYPELERAQRSVSDVLGVCPGWYRPPQGRKTPFIEATVHRHGMQMVLWDVSAGDAKVSDPKQIARQVLRKVRSGSIIDLKEDLDSDPVASRSALVRVMPEILAGLRARHLQPVRLDELLHGAPYTSCT
ncbi:MAG TPA: NAD-dependent epimerase/dehydratase family protein [Acidimicrobiia bacterium]